MNQRDDYSYELISAFLDGEVSPDERARVEQLVASSSEHRQMLDDMRAVTRGMQRLPSYCLDGEFAQRVSEMARQSTGIARDITVARSGRFAPVATAWHWPAIAGLAATAAAAMLVAFLVGNSHTGSTGLADGQRVAQASVASADSTHDESSAADIAPLVTAPNRDHVGPSAIEPVVDFPPSSAKARSPSDTVVQAALPATEATIASDSASARPASLPASAVVTAEQATSRSLPAQSRVGDPAASGDGEQLPQPFMSEVPFSEAQQLLLVIDVALTQQGAERDAFERALAATQIPLEGTVTVDPKLEESLLASQFFEPVKTPPDSAPVAPTDITLMYVGTRASHVDEICNEMQSNAGEFAAIGFDMAILPSDQALFQQLRQTVQRQVASIPPVANSQLGARRDVAHRLALAPSWRGTLSPKLKSVKDVLDTPPGWPLDRDAAKRPLVEKTPGQSLPQVPLPSGGRLGENIEAEVLFVVHVGRRAQE
ncbi:MAG: anti-sigma factor family protein [Pirellulaceae bacterium]